jgi:hypothetical protein
MLQFIGHTFEADTYTRIVAALLAISAGLLTKRVLSHTLLAVVLVPGFTFAALFSNYLFEQYAIYLTSDRETNVVFACTLGIILALFVLVGLVRLAAVAAEACAARYQFTRGRPSARRLRAGECEGAVFKPEG